MQNKVQYLIILCLISVLHDALQAQLPLGRSENWVLINSLSDEFNESEIDGSKWDYDTNDWGPWSWEPDNAYITDSILHLRMRYEPHIRNNTQLYYKSGIARSYNTITYGFFEARVKGCETFPGASPAFWLYSKGEQDHPTIHYSEIDIIELQQANWSDGVRNGPNHIDMNLHTRVYDENGIPQWIRPGDNPALCKHEWDAPWDTRDDFHIYAVESRPDSIFWFIDGVLRASAENRYWHLPMHVTLSLGLRYPHVKYIDGDRYPVPEEATAVGFPTSMKIDYVRSWMLDDIGFHERKELVNTGSIFNIDIDYSAPASREITLLMSDSSGIVLGDTTALVSRGMGKVRMNIQTDSVIPPGKSLQLKIESRAICDTCTEIIDTDSLLIRTIPGVDAQFNVEDKYSGEPLQGAVLFFNGKEYETDQEGRVSINDLPLGTYTLEVVLQHYEPFNIPVVTISDDSAMTIELQPVMYNVKIVLIDQKTGVPVPDAAIKSITGTINTDLLGIVYAAWPYGNMDLEISRDYFESLELPIEIYSDTTLTFEMKRIAADLRFRIYHQITPLEEVEVIIGENTRHTATDGEAFFPGLSADTSLTYSIYKTGFQLIEDQLTLDSDTLVKINLSEETGIFNASKTGINIYPNPVRDQLYIEGVETGGVFSIINLMGDVVSSGIIEDDQWILQLYSVSQGLYILKFNENIVAKFIKTQ